MVVACIALLVIVVIIVYRRRHRKTLQIAGYHPNPPSPGHTATLSAFSKRVNYLSSLTGIGGPPVPHTQARRSVHLRKELSELDSCTDADGR